MATDGLGNNLLSPSKVETTCCHLGYPTFPLTHIWSNREILANVHQDKGTRILTVTLFLTL